jgi:hypothetical protein
VNIARNTSRPAKFSEIWQQSLFVFDYGSNPEKVMLHEYASKEADQFKSISQVSEDNRTLIEIIFRHRAPNNREYRFLIDPAMNYLIRKFENRDVPGTPHRGEQFYEVVKFSEIRHGIFIPTETRFVTTPAKNDPDQRIDSVTVLLTDVQVNLPLPPSTFQPPISPKSHVLDTIEHVTYTVGPKGEKLNLQSNTVGLPPSVAEKHAHPPQEATTEEPKSWTRWILPASLLGLCAAGIIAWRRKRAVAR